MIDTTATLNKDLNSSIKEFLEKIRPNPLIGFSLLNLGTSGWLENRRPRVWIRLAVTPETMMVTRMGPTIRAVFCMTSRRTR